MILSRRLSIASLIGLVVLAGYELSVDAQQTAKIESFMHKGPRFTAADGQALCERVQKLEPQPQPCRYAPTEPSR